MKEDRRKFNPGPPVQGQEPRQRYSVSLEPRHAEWLIALGGGNLSGGVRAAVEKLQANEERAKVARAKRAGK